MMGGSKDKLSLAGGSAKRPARKNFNTLCQDLPSLQGFLKRPPIPNFHLELQLSFLPSPSAASPRDCPLGPSPPQSVPALIELQSNQHEVNSLNEINNALGRRPNSNQSSSTSEAAGVGGRERTSSSRRASSSARWGAIVESALIRIGLQVTSTDRKSVV